MGMGRTDNDIVAEMADRQGIRELIDAYATCADRRDAAGQMALFTEDTVFSVFMDSEASEASYALRGRQALAPVFADLNQYHATTHFNGQSTIHLDGARGTGETYCLAHHLTLKEGERTLMVASLRYQDVFVKEKGRWLFSERTLLVDWIDTRPSAVQIEMA